MNDMNQIEIKISNEEINYKEAVLFMESKVRDISENHSKELLWFLSHNHIFTQGTSASDDEILNSDVIEVCLLYTSPSPRDISGSRMPSSA